MMAERILQALIFVCSLVAVTLAVILGILLFAPQEEPAPEPEIVATYDKHECYIPEELRDNAEFY